LHLFRRIRVRIFIVYDELLNTASDLAFIVYFKEERIGSGPASLIS
jgi:hypothetical protein